jgi:transposase
MREAKVLGVPQNMAMRPYGLGVDVAKNFHAICLLVPYDSGKKGRSGEELKRVEWECKNNPEALRAAKRRILRHLAHLGVKSNQISYCFESTATYHCPLLTFWGGHPCIVNPALAASFKARKTDRIDAFKLAQQHLQGLWPESYIPDENTQLLRMLTRMRKRFRAMASRCINAISTRLWQWSCQFPDSKSPASPSVRALIEDFHRGDFRVVGAPGFERWECAPHVPPLVWDVLCRTYQIADLSNQMARWCEKKVPELAGSDLAKRLQTVPGVGPIAAATWIAEVEPTDRFPTVAHCIAYCGLDPTPQISGGKKVGTKLRFGNSHIRPQLMQCAQVALNHDSPLRDLVLSKTKKRKLAVVICARKIATILYHISRSGGTYDVQQTEAAVRAAIERQRSGETSVGA